MKFNKVLCYFFIVFFTFSCQSLKKSFDSGNYDAVISQFIKLKKVSDDDIALFEKSYKIALQHDKEKVTYLKSINDGSRWEEIFNLYTKIDNRQNNILRILPVYYTNGTKADIEIFGLSAALEESRQNAAQNYYDQGLKLLNSGVKSSIRQSVDYFTASKKFYINYKDVNELIEEALTKGKNYVLLVVEKNPTLLLPPAFEQSILDNVKLTQNNDWLDINYNLKQNVVYDYVVKLNLYDIIVSPDALKEIHTTEEKTVEDGWQYVLDAKGNVQKDSLGNDIKVPKYTKISCQVKETRLNKTAQIYGDATIYEARTKDYIKNKKCTGNATFNYSYFQINGNRNALSTATIQKLNNSPRNFPNTFDMVELAKTELIRCYQDFVSANYNAFSYTK